MTELQRAGNRRAKHDAGDNECLLSQVQVHEGAQVAGFDHCQGDDARTSWCFYWISSCVISIEMNRQLGLTKGLKLETVHGVEQTRLYAATNVAK